MQLPEHSHINPDRQYSRFSVKLFRRLTQFLVGLAIARIIAFLSLIPGLQWFSWCIWAAWAVMTIPPTLQIWANIQSGKVWCDGINPAHYLILWLVAIALIGGMGLEHYRLSLLED